VIAGRFSATVYHLRPTLWPFVWAHCLTGFLIAYGREAVRLPTVVWLQGLTASGVWAVLLVGAAGGIAAVFRAMPDESLEVGGASSTMRAAAAAPVPAALGWVAVCMFLLGMVISPAVTWRYFDAYLVGVVLAVIHSTPPIRLGRLPLGSLSLQLAGLVTLTFCAGIAAAPSGNVELSLVTPYLFAFVFLFIGLWTLFPPEPSRLMPLLYAVCVLGGFLCFGLAGAQMGKRWNALLLGLPPLAGWAILGLMRFCGRRTATQTPKLIYALCVWLLTDAAVVLSALIR